MASWIEKKIKPLLILDKTKRKEYRKQFKKEKPQKIDKNAMKIGVSYSVWDGEELLEHSLLHVRQSVDYINVVWQRLSWHGKECDSNLPALLEKLKSKGLIDEIIEWEPDLSGKTSPHHNELNKRNVGLEYVKKANCNYFLIMDTDEFYKKKEFEEAKEHILRNNITRSYIKIISYNQKPTYQKIAVENFWPFLYKIEKDSVLESSNEIGVPLLIDGTKKMRVDSCDKVWIFDKFFMHHMSGVRKNIKRKLYNSSANIDINQELLSDMLKTTTALNDENLQELGYVKVPNEFNIPKNL